MFSGLCLNLYVVCFAVLYMLCFVVNNIKTWFTYTMVFILYIKCPGLKSVECCDGYLWIVFPAAPSPPQQVQAIPSIPGVMSIQWQAPAEPRGNIHTIVYDIIYYSYDDGRKTPERIKHAGMDPPFSENVYKYDVRGLESPKEYFFKVTYVWSLCNTIVYKFYVKIMGI